MERQQSDAMIALREVVRRVERPVIFCAGRFVHFQSYDIESTVIPAVYETVGLPDIDAVNALMAGCPFSFLVRKRSILGERASTANLHVP